MWRRGDEGLAAGGAEPAGRAGVAGDRSVAAAWRGSVALLAGCSEELARSSLRRLRIRMLVEDDGERPSGWLRTHDGDVVLEHQPWATGRLGTLCQDNYAVIVKVIMPSMTGRGGLR